MKRYIVIVEENGYGILLNQYHAEHNAVDACAKYKLYPEERTVGTGDHTQVFVHDTCQCGNPEMGFPCACWWMRLYPGSTSFTCEYCGLYSASLAKCNKCEAIQTIGGSEPPVTW